MIQEVNERPSSEGELFPTQTLKSDATLLRVDELRPHHSLKFFHAMILACLKPLSHDKCLRDCDIEITNELGYVLLLPSPQSLAQPKLMNEEVEWSTSLSESGISRFSQLLYKISFSEVQHLGKEFAVSKQALQNLDYD